MSSGQETPGWDTCVTGLRAASDCEHIEHGVGAASTELDFLGGRSKIPEGVDLLTLVHY